MVFLILLLVVSVFSVAPILPEGTQCTEPSTSNDVVPLSTVIQRENALLNTISLLEDKLDLLNSTQRMDRAFGPFSDFPDCLSILELATTLGYTLDSGTYYVMIPGNQKAVPAYCDMDEDGGGWTLVMNYYAKGGADAPNTYLTSTLPVYSEHTLGFDGSTVPSEWGQAANSLMAKMDFTRLRFYCVGTVAYQSVHITTTSGVDYVKTGTGSFFPLKNVTKLTGHYDDVTYIPEGVTSGYSNKGNLAMTNFPFFISTVEPLAHWNTGIHFTGTHYYYACNSNHMDTSGSSFLHQVFMR